ncbi:hypothetical protein [Microbacterium dauci]|uniref:Alginate lyase domain-containing protein n=1 Tax=Microbacterium dauci TaxID=3048008 RepID=A0ABT6ZCD9_9MICO|nr:hypothetical protein [Microbacterium sp. LX3-4]MDJ1113824.1 hypothetical protein [Microbacterium sp. LX3-4]
MFFHSRAGRVVAAAVVAALALGSQPSVAFGNEPADAMLPWPVSGPLPEVAPIQGSSIDLAAFDGLEQDVAPYLGNVARLANSVHDDNPTNYGFITCGCWRPGQGTNDARVMENVLTLGYFYATDRPWNAYFHDEALGLRFNAAVQFLLTRQNADGSFPQGGGDLESRAATGFALELYAELLDLLETDPTIDPRLTDQLTAALKRAAGWFLEDVEVWGPRGDQFANQVASGLVGISNLVHRFDDPTLRARFEERLTEHRATSQSEAGFYRDGTVAHRYSLEVESEDLVGWGDPATRGVIDQMQTAYMDWAQYQLLYDQELDGFFINTATDSRHRGWNYADQIPIGANHLWSGVIPQAGAYGRTAEVVAEERATFAAGTWDSTVAPKIAAAWSYMDPALVRDVVLGAENYPSATERLDAIATLRPYAPGNYTDYRADSLLGQEFVFAKRDTYVTALSFGKHVNTQYGFWDNQRFGLNYLYDPEMGVVIQSQNAPAIGGPRTRPAASELSWGTGRVVGGVFRMDSYDQPEPSYSIAGAPTDPDDAGATDALEVSYAPADGTVIKKVTLGEELSVAVSTFGAFFERIPLIVGESDELLWDNGNPVPDGTSTSAPTAHGVILHRDGRSLEITWDGDASATIRPTSFPVAGGQRTLQVLDINATGALKYSLRILDDRCPASNTAGQVVIGKTDTGVANIDDGTGCTINDLLRADEQWPSHDDFVSHVTAVLNSLVQQAMLTGKDKSRIVRAVAQSDIGKDRVTVTGTSQSVTAGSDLVVRVSGTRVSASTVSGPCLVEPASLQGAGEVTVTVRETLLPGECTLAVRTELTAGTVEQDQVPLAIVAAADGTVFRDSFSSPPATEAAWTSVDGVWSATEGVFRQSDTTRTGWRSVVDGLRVADGSVEVDVTFRSTATSTAFAGVQLRTANAGDAYTTSGYLVYVRQNGSVDVYRAGQGVIASGTGSALSGTTTLRVEADGATLRVFVGTSSVPRVTVTDPNPVTGAGFVQLITGRAAVDFDNVRVRQDD